jgi:glycosyltransferase involved in cell wall biosynthesis
LFVFDLILATRRKAMTGVERYGVHLFEAVKKIEPDSVAFVHDASAFSSADGLIMAPEVYRDWALLPWLIRQHGLSPTSVIFPTAPASPLFYSVKTPLCRIVHDAFPWTRTGAKLQGRLLYRDVERLMASRYDRLCGTTEFVARELVPFLGRSDIEWCGNAPGLDMWSLGPKELTSMPARFVLAVGTIEPRKDYARLIQFAEAAPQGAPAIVIVGRAGWGDAVAQVENAARRLANVIWLNDLTEDAAVLWLYRNADCFISLSRAEGFNMPLVEASMCGRPILCSDLPIHGHVAPSWARFVGDTDSPERIWRMLGEGGSPPAPVDVEAYRRKYGWDNVARRLLNIIAA